MTAQDHKQHAQDLFKRALICTDKDVRSALMNLAKDHLSYYHELQQKEVANLDK